MENETIIIRNTVRSNFTIIPNAIFKNGLSARAIGLLCYMLHVPEGFKLNKTTLHYSFKEGRDAVISAWDELCQKGYVKSEMIHEENGTFKGYKHTITDTPFTDFQETAPSPEKPLTGFPSTGKPFTDFQEHNNTIYNKNYNNKSSASLISPDVEIIETGSVPVRDHQDGTSLSGKKKNSPQAPQKKEKKVDPLYTELMKLYYDWFKAKSGGIPPKIDGQEGKGLKSIITWLKTAVNDKLGDQEILEVKNAEAVKMFQYILGRWNTLEPFIQKQVKLSQISSNLTNIVNYLKSEHGKQTRKGQVIYNNSSELGEAVNEAVNDFLNRKG